MFIQSKLRLKQCHHFSSFQTIDKRLKLLYLLTHRSPVKKLFLYLRWYKTISDWTVQWQRSCVYNLNEAFWLK